MIQGCIGLRASWLGFHFGWILGVEWEWYNVWAFGLRGILRGGRV